MPDPSPAFFALVQIEDCFKIVEIVYYERGCPKPATEDVLGILSPVMLYVLDDEEQLPSLANQAAFILYKKEWNTRPALAIDHSIHFDYADDAEIRTVAPLISRREQLYSQPIQSLHSAAPDRYRSPPSMECKLFAAASPDIYLERDPASDWIDWCRQSTQTLQSHVERVLQRDDLGLTVALGNWTSEWEQKVAGGGGK